jgi:hypothetical protein
VSKYQPARSSKISALFSGCKTSSTSSVHPWFSWPPDRAWPQNTISPVADSFESLGKQRSIGGVLAAADLFKDLDQLMTHRNTVRLDFLPLVSQRGVISQLLGANSDELGGGYFHSTASK